MSPAAAEAAAGFYGFFFGADAERSSAVLVGLMLLVLGLGGSYFMYKRRGGRRARRGRGREDEGRELDTSSTTVDASGWELNDAAKAAASADAALETAASSPSLSAPLINAKSFALVPYSVLGTRLTIAKGVVELASEPAGSVAFVDPAGLPYVQELGPSQAGAASGAIYSFLGIRSDAAFPADVKAAVTATALAKHHKYVRPNGEVAHCIHAVGPDFREPTSGPDDDPRAHAVASLAKAYENVLVEFDACGADTLRLLPISSGVFAGPWRGEMPAITMEALNAACAALRPWVVRRIHYAGKRLELCIFMESEWQGFLDAGFRVDEF